MLENNFQISYRYTLEYPRDHVWEQLNDPEVLAACIRGCAYVERESPTVFRAVIRAHLGELKKDFGIHLDVDDTHAPAEYSLSSVVSAGLLGKVKGKADVDLQETGEKTSSLHYTATLSGRGLLGKTLPLIEGVATHRVHEFFDRFVEHLED